MRSTKYESDEESLDLNDVEAMMYLLSQFVDGERHCSSNRSSKLDHRTWLHPLEGDIDTASQ